MAHKLCESLVGVKGENFSGEVEINIFYVTKPIRYSNRIESRVDRRLTSKRNPNRRTVMVILQRGKKGEEASKTRTFLMALEISLVIGREISV